MARWLSRLNLIVLFVLLMVFHSLLYYYLGTAAWFGVALTASAVDTAVVAVLQLFVLRGERRKGGQG